MGKCVNRNMVFGIRVLAFAIFVCAWLLPACAGVAGLASSKAKISLVVADSVGMNVGKSVLDPVSDNSNCQIIREFVTETGSSRLSDKLTVNELSGPRAITRIVLTHGQKVQNTSYSADLSDDNKLPAIEESELVVTASNL